MDLSEHEIRVLGCLLEKQRTTPEQYPLSLNSLRLACNQSTNRDPVVQYDEPTIREALRRLERRGFTRFASGAGSRAPKYRHLLAEALPMSDAEQAVMCVLMLRGSQTPGELKQRTERMHRFGGLEEVHATLGELIDRGLVARRERRPGQKEERYTQLLGADASPSDWPAQGDSAGGQAGVAGGSAGVAGGQAGLAGGQDGVAGGSAGVAGRSAGVAGGQAGLAGGQTHPEGSSAQALGAQGGEQERRHVTGAPIADSEDEPIPASVNPSGRSAELTALAERVERLERELAELRGALPEHVR